MKRRPIVWARTQAIHWARMIPGVHLCVICWGWVDDPRHGKIGPPAERVSSDLFAR